MILTETWVQMTFSVVSYIQIFTILKTEQGNFICIC